jgi:hypothetical protein
MGQYGYVIVRFAPRRRPVYMDGGDKSIGFTNTKLRVRKMYHEFDLGGGGDYAPEMIPLQVKGGITQPDEIEFTAA